MVLEFLRVLSPRSTAERPGLSAAGLALAVLVAVLTLALAIASEVATGTAVFSTLVLPVVFAAWFGGLRMALFFMAVIMTIAWLVILPPRWSLELDAAGVLRLGFLAITSAIVTFLVERLRAEARRTDELMRELERSNDARGEFVRHIAHELRTPMTTIKGNSIIVRDRWNTLEQEDRVGALEDVVGAVERLEGITDNLLSLARLESGYTTEREPVIVAEVVKAVVERHKKSNPQRSYEVIENASRRPVICSPVYLEQVVENLLSNAEKYSPSAEPITTRIDRTNTAVSVSILDRGKGIKPDEAHAMFDPFYRAADVVGIPGLGIGLSVCKRFAEAEGGFMSASARDGGGTQFTLTLPVASIPASPI